MSYYPTRDHIVAIAVLKYLKSIVDSYKGTPEGFREWLLGRLEELDRKTDEIMVKVGEYYFT